MSPVDVDWSRVRYGHPLGGARIVMDTPDMGVVTLEVLSARGEITYGGVRYIEVSERHYAPLSSIEAAHLGGAS